MLGSPATASSVVELGYKVVVVDDSVTPVVTDDSP